MIRCAIFLEPCVEACLGFPCGGLPVLLLVFFFTFTIMLKALAYLPPAEDGLQRGHVSLTFLN